MYVSPSRIYVRMSGRESEAIRISVSHEEDGLVGYGRSSSGPSVLGLFWSSFAGPNKPPEINTPDIVPSSCR